MNLIERSRKLAHEAHDSIGQVRKYTGEPYWVHTDEVSNTLAGVLLRENTFSPEEVFAAEVQIAAGHGHDILEDVYPKYAKYDYNLIAATTNLRVLGVIIELTDEYTKEKYPTWNRAKRHEAEVERLKSISIWARNVKLADLISNTRDIASRDKNFARTYLKEKEKVLIAIEWGANPILLSLTEKSLADGYELLKA